MGQGDEMNQNEKQAGSGLSAHSDASERLKFFAKMVKEGWGFCTQCGITGVDEDGTCPTCGATAQGQALTALAEDVTHTNA
jgi:rubrerythrin